MNKKYIIGKLLAIPAIPLLYLQAKRIKYRMPTLPEAEDTIGTIGDSPKELKILSIGESSIAGVGVKSHSKSLNGFLSRYLSIKKNVRVRWEVIAKSGYTVKKVNQLLIPQLKDDAPDVVLVGIGGNDTFQTNSPSNWAIEIKSLIQNIKRKYPKSPIVFLNMPPLRDIPVFPSLMKFFLGNLNDLFSEELSKIVRQFDNVWFNEKKISLSLFSKLSGGNHRTRDFFSDGVHPSELTYRIWGEQMGRFIEKVI